MFLRFSSRTLSATPSPILSMLNGEPIPQPVRLLLTWKLVKPLLLLTWSMLSSVPVVLFTVSVPKSISLQLSVSYSPRSPRFGF